MRDISSKQTSETHAKALKWIIDQFDQADINYALCGGIAAAAYGSQRPLNDLDFFVTDNDLARASAFDVSQLSRPLSNHIGDHWKLDFVAYEYSGIAIEITSPSRCSIRSTPSDPWQKIQVTFGETRSIVVLGTRVEVMDPYELIQYKSSLAREVDHLDIQQMAPLRGSD